MRTLLLMRHAKSSWKNPGLTDHQRPLNQRGRRTAVRMGRLIAEEKLEPELIICSTSQRTRETVDLILGQFAGGCLVEYTDDLYHASPDDIVKVIGAVDAAVRRLLIVGHNPGLEELIGVWANEDLHIPTAALAEYALPNGGWSDLTVERSLLYRRFWQPKDLGPLDDF